MNVHWPRVFAVHHLGSGAEARAVPVRSLGRSRSDSVLVPIPYIIESFLTNSQHC